MDFYAVLDQILALLRSRGRVSYQALKLQFALDDETLEALKEELHYAQHPVTDEAGRGLVWNTPADASPALALPLPPPPRTPRPRTISLSREVPPVDPHVPDAERRQLTVMFCDLVDSTVLASQLDPEDLREVIRAYQATCAEVIQHYGGHIAQYLGDGLLIYFGYPRAHEDDAQRAVRTGLGMLEAMVTLNTRLQQVRGFELAIRLGIHTGLVVVGQMGAGGRHERLALGETPNIAARLQGIAEPNTVVMSAATAHLVEGYFRWKDLGPHMLKGVSSPLHVYRILSASDARGRLDVAVTRGLTPLIGREQEVQLLLAHWERVKDGLGHGIVLRGEAGIGKSRLVQVLKEQVVDEPHVWLECRCSPYYRNHAFYPVTDLWERLLAFSRDDTPDEKVDKLERLLSRSRLALPEVVPLFAALLSLPLPADRYPPLHLTPQRQRHQTLDTLLAFVLELTEQQPVVLLVEDLHWSDPSTVELLSLLMEHGATARLLTLLTCRPAFQSPWSSQAHVTLVALQRLPQPQVQQMIMGVTEGLALPLDLLRHIVAKTDGVPLFVEELTKMVLESGFLKQARGQYELTGPWPSQAIPATLHDALMARMDRLDSAKGVAQVGAVLGRSFSYELLRAVAPVDEAVLPRELERLVEAELLLQQGSLPQATYLFKHALIQDAAYHSLLRNTRQQYHQRIAQVLAEQFSDMAATQPELLAHHYTEAGLNEQAVQFWHHAGQYASERSAHMEAAGHLTKGLEVLQTLPETPERTHQDLALQILLGQALIAIKGYAAPDVQRTYARAQELCQDIGETPQLFWVLWGLQTFYMVRAELQTAWGLGEQLLRLAQHQHDPALLLEAHYALGNTLFWRGELTAAQTHLEHSLAIYPPQPRRSLLVRRGTDPAVGSLATMALTLWLLGYPDQALERMHAALALARELAHPFSLAHALNYAAGLHIVRGEGYLAHERAEATIALATEQGFPHWQAGGAILQGWTLAEHGHREQGIAQMRQSIATIQAIGAEVMCSWYLGMLAEAYRQAGQIEAGLTVVAEALGLVEQHGERFGETELYRLKGELLLRRAQPDESGAEICWQQALDIVRRQQAKSLELRVAMSLSRLWQQRGKRDVARQVLAATYGWFTEGFDTADLQEAKALLEALA